MIVVVKPGLLDMVMDLGRPGFRAQGVPEGGAADAPALIRANRLVGNPDDAAGLEITLRGPELSFPDGASVAFSGAVMAANLDGDYLQPERRHEVRPGGVILFGKADSGIRAYLAVAGGIDVPRVLGSRSTFLPGGWGGWQGRALMAGDGLPVGGSAGNQVWECLPGHGPRLETVLRVLPGPQLNGFSDAALARFLGQPYVVHADANRVGIRLAGEALDYQKGEIASQPVLPGAIQVPPSGQPIILGWDGPVTGGYPVIGGVISADMPRLAQLGPGDSLRFRVVSHEEALQAWQHEGLWTG
jgi:biotin-dependent carboxylase-like uncharacterized protein